MKNLQLTIDLVPESAWGSNLRCALAKKDWDTLRHACYERCKHRCAACGLKTDKLDAHEVWDYNTFTKTQTLVDIVALCASCHLVKHMKHAMAEGKLEIAKNHFYRVNKCDANTFAQHFVEAEMLYAERSKVDKWILKAPTLAKLGGEGIEVKQPVRIEIVNPYENVDWSKSLHIKAALHTHTVNSLPVDRGAGNTKPEDLVKAYEKFGFDAIVITDHDYVSYVHGNPLLNVMGNELSKEPEHILSYGTAYEDKIGRGFDQNIENIKATGGIAYIAHPNRSRKSIEWWVEKLLKHDTIKGIEVLNTRRFSRDSSQKVWDEILSKTMPYRMVLGIATDDNHSHTSHEPTSDLGAGYTTLLLSNDQMNNQGFFGALKSGAMYFSSHRIAANENGDNDDKKPRQSVLPPKILSIEVRDKTIKVKADRANKIEWIASCQVVRTVESKLKSFETSINVRDVEGGYIRFRLIGEGGQTLSQPFGIIRS